jgi:ABC-2 type transport system ATP-binding protein
MPAHILYTMGMQSAAVTFDQLSVRFASRKSEVVALDNISLVVPCGTVFGFLGPNGAGKTTAIHVLLGFQQATAGRATIFDCDVRAAIARQRIGYLPEHPDAYRFLTGREMLQFAGKLCGLSGAILAQRIQHVLQEVDLADAASRRIATYSRGMRQRICLAQALLHEPDLLILDEPTGGLDPIGRLLIRRIITDWRQRGKTVFFSSHELSEVELVCDQVCMLARGRIVAQGAPHQLAGPGERLEQFFMRVVEATAVKEGR